MLEGPADPSRLGAVRRLAPALLLNSVAEQFRSRRRFEANVRILHLEPSVADASGELADRDELQRGFQALSIEHRTKSSSSTTSWVSVGECAVSLGIPAGTARSRLHYALAALRAPRSDAAARDEPIGRVPA